MIHRTCVAALLLTAAWLGPASGKEPILNIEQADLPRLLSQIKPQPGKPVARDSVADERRRSAKAGYQRGQADRHLHGGRRQSPVANVRGLHRQPGPVVHRQPG
jgi:hypothetical protein